MQAKFSIAGSRREARAVVLAPAMMEEVAAPLMLYGRRLPAPCIRGGWV
jgi:hypothetical protein